MTMRYMMISRTDPGTPQSEPDEKIYAELGAFTAELTERGVLVATGAMEPGGVRVKSVGGEITDEPAAATDAAPVGFALVDVASLAEAIALSKRFWGIVGDGEGEIRQVFGPGD